MIPMNLLHLYFDATTCFFAQVLGKISRLRAEREQRDKDVTCDDWYCTCKMMNMDENGEVE